MGRIFHSGLSPQESLSRSRELLQWAERVLDRDDLTPRVRSGFERVVTKAKKAITVQRVAMRASIKPVR